METFPALQGALFGTAVALITFPLLTTLSSYGALRRFDIFLKSGVNVWSAPRPFAWTILVLQIFTIAVALIAISLLSGGRSDLQTAFFGVGDVLLAVLCNFQIAMLLHNIRAQRPAPARCFGTGALTALLYQRKEPSKASIITKSMNGSAHGSIRSRLRDTTKLG